MPRLHCSRASTIILVIVFLFVAVAVDSVPDSAIKCSRQCIAERCDDLSINYGKYCGAGYWGCPGEAPCDDVDACCKSHDDCVDRFGMLHVKCHERLRNCLTRALKSGKPGFSKECPVSRAAPTMIRGMDLAILLCQQFPGEKHN